MSYIENDGLVRKEIGLEVDVKVEATTRLMYPDVNHTTAVGFLLLLK
jgi:hypothetical protein